MLEHGPSTDMYQSRQMFFIASFVWNLHWIELDVPANFASVTSSRSLKAVMWHRRCAHVDFDTLAHIALLNFLTGSALTPADFLQALLRFVKCKVCIRKKIHNQLQELTTYQGQFDIAGPVLLLSDNSGSIRRPH